MTGISVGLAIGDGVGCAVIGASIAGGAVGDTDESSTGLFDGTAVGLGDADSSDGKSVRGLIKNDPTGDWVVLEIVGSSVTVVADVEVGVGSDVRGLIKNDSIGD